MKKTIILLLAVASLFTTMQSCDNASGASSGKPEVVPALEMADESITTLKEIGFTNVPSVVLAENNAKRKYWKDKVGLNYISLSEMQWIMTNNGLIIGESTRYTAEIPAEMLPIISKNYNHLKTITKADDSYICPDGRVFSAERVRAMSQSDADWVTGADGKGGHEALSVYVVAQIEYFDTQGMQVVNGELKVKPKDPIVVIKMDGGYLELARW